MKFVWFFVVLVVCVSAFGDVGIEDYQRADGLWKLTRNKVLNAKIEPGWFDGNKFCYREDEGDGRRKFWLVDSAEGTKTVGFDHNKLAASLNINRKKKVAADRLPIDKVA